LLRSDWAKEGRAARRRLIGDTAICQSALSSWRRGPMSSENSTLLRRLWRMA
jgi:hypothetical protein